MLHCDDHDYLEIACTFRLPVRLVLKEGGSLEGVPRDTGYTPDRQECLLLEVDGERQPVIMAQIKTLIALQDNPHFSVVELG